jgi:hypothetical protein
VYSGATGALVRTLESPNPEPNGRFGIVAGLGDLDADGTDDFAVGAADEGSGRAYVYSGATGALVRTLESPNPEPNGRFGIVARIGDLDADSVDDIAVAAQGESGLRGRTYHFSAASGTLLRTLASPKPEPFGQFGLGQVEIGDVNGDSVADIAVGASGEVEDSGRVYVFSGATGSLLRTLQSPGGGWYGVALASLPDLDGDGLGELAVGSPYESVNGLRSGAVHIVSLATGAMLAVAYSPTPELNGGFGSSVAFLVGPGGVPALAVGAPYEDPGSSPDAAGRAYVFDLTGFPVTAIPAPASAALALTIAPTPSAGDAVATLTLVAPSAVHVSVVDALGRTVATVHDGPLGAGRHRLALPAGLAPGVYAVRVTSGEASATARWVVAR